MTRRRTIPGQLERDFQRQITDLLTLYGYHWYHTHDSRRSRAGFPDLVAWRPGRLMFIELKADTGYLSLAQRRVIGQLRAAGQDVYVWKPTDWPEIQTVIAQRTHTPQP